MNRIPYIFAFLAALLLAACGKKEPVEKTPEAPAAPRIEAARVVEAGPTLAPDASAFESAPELAVTLVPQVVVAPFNAQTSVGQVKVRAVHDGKWLSLRLDWADITADMASGISTFEDMVAVQIPTRPGTVPNPMMGDTTNPVTIFLWRAGHQAALDRGERPDTSHAYPYYHRDLDIVDLLGDEAGAPYRGAAGLGNPVSLGDMSVSPVFVQVAEGFGTLTTLPGRHAEGRGIHDGARWRVALHIPLGGDKPVAAALTPGGESLMNFAAWDGSHAEAGSRKSWSPAWTAIHLAP
jgi:hypothetical protein